MIEIKNVTKYYGLKEVGLMDVSLNLKEGEIIGILGRNGSGKTTLLKSIMGLGETYEGEILVDGKKPGEMYHDMAFISEEGSYFPNMTSREYGIFLATFFEKFNLERYLQLIQFFELKLDVPIRKFSKGQKAKLETCAGLSKNTKYILMDEPFLGKDLMTRKTFLKLLISTFQENQTILIATHLIDEIENVLDRAIFLSFGRLQGSVVLDELKAESKTLGDAMLEICHYDIKNIDLPTFN